MKANKKCSKTIELYTSPGYMVHSYSRKVHGCRRPYTRVLFWSAYFILNGFVLKCSISASSEYFSCRKNTLSPLLPPLPPSFPWNLKRRSLFSYFAAQEKTAIQIGVGVLQFYHLKLHILPWKRVYLLHLCIVDGTSIIMFNLYSNIRPTAVVCIEFFADVADIAAPSMFRENL